MKSLKKGLTKANKYDIIIKALNKVLISAGMAELADALDSGSSEVTFVQVQVLLPAPKKDCNFDTKLQSFLTKSAFVGINPLRG